MEESVSRGFKGFLVGGGGEVYAGRGVEGSATAITHREILLLESGAVRHDLRDRGDDQEGAEAAGH